MGKVSKAPVGVKRRSRTDPSRNGAKKIRKKRRAPTSRKKEARDLEPGEWAKLQNIQALAAQLRDPDLGFGTTLWLGGIRRITKSGDQAAIFCQLLYWHGKGKDSRTRMRARRVGHYWVAKSYREFGDEVGLTERQARSALDWLVNAGLVVRENFRFLGKKVCHLRIDADTFAAALDQLVEE